MADIKVHNAVAASLRPLAASLNFKMSRGPGMLHEMGSIPGLLSGLAEAYESDPDGTRDLFSQILDKRASVAEAIRMIKHDGAIIT